VRLADLVQRLAQSLEISDAEATRIARGLVATVSLGDLADPWNSDAFQIRPARGFGAVSAVAGQFSKVQLSNGYNVGAAADTGVLVVPLRCRARVSVAMDVNFQVALNPNEVPNITTSLVFGDMRLIAQGKAPAASIRTGTTAAGGTTHYRLHCTVADTEYEIPLNYILQSGYGIQAYGGAVNTDLVVAWDWFEINAPLLAV
jgi:hypothetical protein